MLTQVAKKSVRRYSGLRNYIPHCIRVLQYHSILMRVKANHSVEQTDSVAMVGYEARTTASSVEPGLAYDGGAGIHCERFGAID
jgi:primosomal replication protein N